MDTPARGLATCEALGYIRNTNALPVLVRLLTHQDRWLRVKAAEALKKMGEAARPVLPGMLEAVVVTAEPLQPVGWDDPIQLRHGELADVFLSHSAQDKAVVSLLAGDLDCQDFKRLPREDEAVVLRTLLETFISRAWCLRQPCDGSAMLTFPSYFRRERKEQPSHPSVLVTYRFDGPADDIYATLVVRLHHTVAFNQGVELWKSAADFKTQTGTKLGFMLTRETEGSSRLEVYFEPGRRTGNRQIRQIRERSLFAQSSDCTQALPSRGAGSQVFACSAYFAVLPSSLSGISSPFSHDPLDLGLRVVSEIKQQPQLKRRSDGAEVFQIKNPRWADYWQQQAYAVMLVIRTSDGEIRWMDVSAYLKRESTGGKTVRQVVFAGERFDAVSVQHWRKKILGGS
jgi:hypothetical protein